MAFPIRFGAAWLLAYREEPFSSEIARLAANVAAGNGFANPYICPTGPSSHTAPAYAFLLSILFGLFSEGPFRQTAIVLQACIASSLLYALLPWAATRLGFSLQTGLAAGLFGALFPLYLSTEARGQWESPLIALAFLLLLVTGIKLGDAPSIRSALQMGILSGVSLYLAPQLLPPLVILLLAACFRSKPALRMAFLATAVSLLLITPWLLRNYLHFEKLIFMRGSLGLELSIAYSDIASPTFAETTPVVATENRTAGRSIPATNPRSVRLSNKWASLPIFASRLSRRSPG
jgi:hypothetical protein